LAERGGADGLAMQRERSGAGAVGGVTATTASEALGLLDSKMLSVPAITVVVTVITIVVVWGWTVVLTTIARSDGCVCATISSSSTPAPAGDVLHAVLRSMALRKLSPVCHG